MNKMKRFGKLLVLLAGVLLCALLLPGKDARAAEIVDIGTCGGEGDGTNLTWMLDTEGTLTISGTGVMKNYYYNNYSRWPKSIKTVIIGNGVTSIGSEAFGNCSSLSSVTIPDSVTSIGRSAFNGCSGLASVTIPDSVTSIGNSAFCDCISLTSVTIPNSVTKMGEQIFGGCTSLTSLTLPFVGKSENDDKPHLGYLFGGSAGEGLY